MKFCFVLLIAILVAAMQLCEGARTTKSARRSKPPKSTVSTDSNPDANSEEEIRELMAKLPNVTISAAGGNGNAALIADLLFVTKKPRRRPQCVGAECRTTAKRRCNNYRGKCNERTTRTTRTPRQRTSRCVGQGCRSSN